jgi:hypothetical protein
MSWYSCFVVVSGSTFSSRRRAVTQRLILPERGAAPAELHVEAHERSVNGLLQGIERRELEAGLDGGLGPINRALVGQQARQGLERQLAQALALGEQPVLEGWLPDSEAGQEIAVIERGRLGKALGRGGGHRLLEVCHVDSDGARVEGDAVGFDPETVSSAGTDGSADAKQGLAERGAGLGLGALAPEEAGQLVTSVGLARRHGEVGDESLGLARGQAHDPIGLEPGPKAVEELEMEARQSVCPLRTWPRVPPRSPTLPRRPCHASCNADGDGFVMPHALHRAERPGAVVTPA